MNKFDYIIIGAGMGGLSTANFLSKYGKKVLVLEKHDKPGGLVTSFRRKGVKFDCGIESLHELGKGETIPQFFEFWDEKIESEEHIENIYCYIDNNEYRFRGEKIKEDFISQFPNDKESIERLFKLNEDILREMFSNDGAPIPPYEMNIFQLIKFGLKNAIKKPNFMKYGMKNFDKVMKLFIKNPVISAIIFSKAVSNMVYMGYVYRWGVVNSSYYPKGGMQAIADKAVKALEGYGGIINLNSEVKEIIVDNGQAIGVKTTKNQIFYANEIISNSSPHFTYKLLKDELVQKRKMNESIKNKKIFQSVCILFMVIKGTYDFKGNSSIYISNSDVCSIKTESFTPDNAPIVINILNKKDNEESFAVIASTPIPYQYNDYWNIQDGCVRGSEYVDLKERVKNRLLDRICEKMGDEFRSSIEHVELATPITFERYTYSKNGSFMGWAIDEKNYGKFMKQETDIRGLYLVGQWVFPGFGVAGVMASGYYLSKDLLKKEGIDLEKDFKEFFEG